ncbi:MAG: right-handed parallel beta-helix repeat-containing protein, partial [Candidatus Micrarchaeia archaeon]
TSSTLFTFGVDSFSGYAAEGLGPISTCRSIYQSGYYYLTQNLNASGLSPDALACINITASNVSLDLMGYSIQDGVVRGVYVYNSAEDISDIHIYNGSISNMTYGIEISEDNTTVSNISIQLSTNAGLYISGANNTAIYNVSVGSSPYGLQVVSNSNTNNTADLLTVWNYSSSPLYIDENSLVNFTNLEFRNSSAVNSGSLVFFSINLTNFSIGFDELLIQPQIISFNSTTYNGSKLVNSTGNMSMYSDCYSSGIAVANYYTLDSVKVRGSLVNPPYDLGKSSLSMHCTEYTFCSYVSCTSNTIRGNFTRLSTFAVDKLCDEVVVLTSDTVLSSDQPVGRCYLINTSYVNLDCAGHSLTGRILTDMDGNQRYVTENLISIQADEGETLTNAAVSNCVIKNFESGLILSENAINSTASNIKLWNGTWGVHVMGQSNTFKDSTINFTPWKGLVIEDANDSKVIGNTFYNYGDEGLGIGHYTTNSLIANNTFISSTNYSTGAIIQYIPLTTQPNITIFNNTISNASLSTPNYGGIYFGINAYSALIDSNIVENITLKGNITTAIATGYANSAIEPSTISNNIVRNIYTKYSDTYGISNAYGYLQNNTIQTVYCDSNKCVGISEAVLSSSVNDTITGIIGNNSTVIALSASVGNVTGANISNISAVDNLAVGIHIAPSDGSEIHIDNVTISDISSYNQTVYYYGAFGIYVFNGSNSSLYITNATIQNLSLRNCSNGNGSLTGMYLSSNIVDGVNNKIVLDGINISDLNYECAPQEAYTPGIGVFIDTSNSTMFANSSVSVDNGIGLVSYNSNNTHVRNTSFVSNGSIAQATFSDGGIGILFMSPGGSETNKISSVSLLDFPLGIKYATSGEAGNNLTDVNIYNSSNYLLIPSQTIESNFTNLKICYNQTTGCIKWDFVNVSAANINSTSNTILDPSFVSINDSDPGTIQFNRSANITLSVSSCTDPNQFTVYKKAGLPLSRDEIISGGSLYNPLSRACTSSTLFTFGVDSFSGYAVQEGEWNITTWVNGVQTDVLNYS